MSDYISKSEVIEMLIDIDWNDGTLTEAISKLADIPTLDEKEIIRNTAERIIDRLEYQEKQYKARAEKFAEALNSWEESRNRGKAYSYSYAIEIVKEECGIND